MVGRTLPLVQAAATELRLLAVGCTGVVAHCSSMGAEWQVAARGGRWTATHKNEPITARSAGDVGLTHDVGTQKPPPAKPSSSGEAAERGVVGWMLRVCQLLANRHRLAILLGVAELDTAPRDLQSLLQLDASSIYRHLRGLRRAGLVVDQVTGFGRGPPRVVSLTGAGRQLLEAFRAVGQQVLRTAPVKSDRSKGATAAPVTQPAGMVKVERGALIGLLELVGDYHQWRLLHGLLDEEAYFVEVRRLQQLAREVGIDLAWVQEQARREGSRGSGGRP
jgi:DNA-binding MarR family transcriptional regulator